MSNGRRVALITGGSRGIGRAISLALAGMGIDIAISYRQDELSAGRAVEECEGLGVRSRSYSGGVEDSAHVERLVAGVVEDFGRLDILVHAAGNASRGNFVVETEPSEVAKVMSVHAFAAHHLARCAIPAMREQSRGDVVLVSSIVSTVPRAGYGPYVMAKAALDALGYTLAMEERDNGIRVNVVAPGLVATDMGDKLVRAKHGRSHASDLDAIAPFGRVCRPEDVAAVVAFLVGEGGGYVTGQRIAVDGGEAWGWWGPTPGEQQGEGSSI